MNPDPNLNPNPDQKPKARPSPNVLNATVKVAIPPESLAAIAVAIQSLQQVLVMHFYDLTLEERQALKKAGLQHEEFMERMRTYIRTLPELVPTYIDGDAIDGAVDAMKVLREHREPLAHTVQLMDDTIAVLSDFAYGGCLTVYSAFKTAADAGQPLAAKAVKALSPAFAGMGKRGKGDPGTGFPSDGEAPDVDSPTSDPAP